MTRRLRSRTSIAIWKKGKEIEQAILDGAAQIAVPAFVSTLSICIVFVPMFFLSGVARYLFVPLAEAVVFAMLASYLLSRTIVPTMAKYLLQVHDEQAVEKKKKSRNPLVRLQLAFEHGFEKLRGGYHNLLKSTVAHPVLFTICFFAACLASFALFPWLGQDFFPAVDGGQFKLHVRAQTGTRIEETARLCDLIENSIRREIPASELSNILDNIGLPYSGINTSYSNSAAIGPADADIQVSLAEKHRPTDEYVHALRGRLASEFPGLTFYFLPADIVSQILNFGLPAPIDIQIVGQNVEANRQYANQLFNQIKYVPGMTDLRIQQPFNSPKLQVDIDRTKSQGAGYTARDVASNLLVALSGSFQTAPTFWLNPENGVSYNISTQTPQYQTDSLQGLGNIPITNSAGTPAADSEKPGVDQPWSGTGHGVALQRAAGAGYLWISTGARSWRRIEGHRPDPGGDQERPAARNASGCSRPGTNDEGVLHRPVGRAGLFDCAGLSADCDQLSILDGSVRYYCCAASRFGGNCMVPVSYAHDAECSSIDGIDYVHGRGDGKQYSRCELRQGADGGGEDCDGGCAGCWVHAFSSGADDSTGDDHRHGADGAGSG